MMRREILKLCVILLCAPIISHITLVKADSSIATPVQITAYLQKIEEILTNTHTSCPKQFTAGSQALSRMTETRSGKIFASNIPQNLAIKDPELVCQIFETGCQIEFGNPFCYATDPWLAQKRENDNDVIRPAKIHAREKFDEFRSSKKLQTLCCKNNKSCRARFAETKLEMENNFYGFRATRLMNGKTTSFYDPGEHKVKLVVSDLTNCLTQECIEDIVLHELGHSCQFSRFYFSKNSFFSGLSQVAASARLEAGLLRTGTSGFDEVFGKEVSACIQDSIRGSQVPNHNEGVEMTEAFAESVFASERKTFFHWVHSCEAGDSSHLRPRKTYMKCLLINGNFLN